MALFPAPSDPAQAPVQTAPAVDPQLVATILHDIFVIGLGAAAFFIKNPNTANRAGQVIQILQGLQLG